MAFVASLRFNDSQGAILGDEESWHLRRNKTFINQSVHPLVKSADVEKHGVELLYAGAGTTSFHRMVIDASRAEITKFLKKNGKLPVSLKQVATIALNEMNRLHRFWRSNRLKHYFDFTMDDFARGWTMIDGEKIPITDVDIQKKARKIIDTNADGGYHNENHALLIGYDQKGVNSFCVKGEIGVLSYVSCGFDVLGKGKYGSCAQFKDVLENLTLKTRRTGFTRDFGVYCLLRGALGASEYYNEAGGHFQLIIIDKNSNNEPRTIVNDQRSRLATEMVWAEMNGLIDRKAVLRLLEKLLFLHKEFKVVEEEFFAAAEDGKLLSLFLRGYKLDDELRSFSTTTVAKTRQKSSRKAKGGDAS